MLSTLPVSDHLSLSATDICTFEIRSQEQAFVQDLLPFTAGFGGEMEGFIHAASLESREDAEVGADVTDGERILHPATG